MTFDPRTHLDLDGPLADFAKERILELAASNLPNEQKMDTLVERLCANLDERWEPKTEAGERRSDFVIYQVLPAFVRFFAQELFSKMRAAGEV